MFCRIKDSKDPKKWWYTIYLCDRKRENGKIKSKDIKVTGYNYISLFENDEEKTGYKEELPRLFLKFLKQDLKRKGYEQYFDMIVEKLKEFKKKLIPIYQQKCEEFEKEENQRKIQEQREYEKFKKRFQKLFNEDIQSYIEYGYNSGVNARDNEGSKNDIDNLSDQERKLLKQAFKLLSNKHHPDKGGDTDTMATINNLKEKILK